MKTSYLSILIAGSFCLGTPALVLGEAPAPPRENNASEKKSPVMRHEHFPEEIFKKMDANNDGKISREEFMKSAEERFSKFDGNKDGFLEKSDVPEKVRERMAEKKGRRAQVGTSGEKKISKEAYLEMNTKRFEKMDTNNDGFVDKAEFESEVKKLHEHAGAGLQGEPRKRPK